MTYVRASDHWRCDRCSVAAYADDNGMRTDVIPAGWVHTMMGEDLCPDCQDQR